MNDGIDCDESECDELGVDRPDAARDPERDVRFTPGPVDVLDHASSAFTFGTKMGIDGTKKWPEEGFDREWPEKIVMSEEVREKVDGMWGALGL